MMRKERDDRRVVKSVRTHQLTMEAFGRASEANRKPATKKVEPDMDKIRAMKKHIAEGNKKEMRGY